MTALIYNFPYYRIETKYPQSSSQATLGGNWQWAAAPQGPDQRIFTLNYDALKYYTHDDESIDSTTNPQINLYCLELFYRQVRQYQSFVFPHPTEGNLTVKFKDPLQIPKSDTNTYGVVKGITVTLVEQPGVVLT